MTYLILIPGLALAVLGTCLRVRYDQARSEPGWIYACASSAASVLFIVCSMLLTRAEEAQFYMGCVGIIAPAIFIAVIDMNSDDGGKEAVENQLASSRALNEALAATLAATKSKEGS